MKQLKRPAMPRLARDYGPALLVVAASLLLWEAIIRLGHVSSDILPAPSLVVSFALPYWSVILGHAWQTLLEALGGLIVAIGLGAATALTLDRSAVARKALYPLLVGSQTIPIIALAPLLLIWLGYGLAPKIIIVTLYCFFPIAIAMASGLAAVDRDQLNLLRTMKASNWQILKLVKIPAALPSFFAGLRIAVAYAMTGAIVGEYVGASRGLGIFIQTSANAHALPLVFAAIFVTAAISLGLFALVGLAERRVTPWRHRDN